MGMAMPEAENVNYRLKYRRRVIDFMSQFAYVPNIVDDMSQNQVVK